MTSHGWSRSVSIFLAFLLALLCIAPQSRGDLKIVVRPYWIASPSTSTHGTGHKYDARVPVLMYGYGIKKGEYIAPSSPIDIAPTLAFLTGVTLPNPMGRVLTEALTTPR